VNHRFGQGIYRFKPDGSALEFLRSTSNNSWGLGFSEEGHLFGSTANGCSNVYLPIPNRYYESVRGWSAGVLPNIAMENRFHPITDKVRQVDWHGGFTSAAGHALYTARTYDRGYWNRTAFVSDPTGHLSATFVLQPVGTDFIARYGWNLLASTDEWTSPIVAEVGPDGHVWLIDWYAYIVQHNPTPQGFTTGKGNAYETPLRDRKHGRIYRMVKKDASAGTAPALTTPEQMVAALRNDNMLWRLHAQRLLVERGKTDVAEALIKEVANDQVDGIGLTPGAIHALWALQGLGLLDGKNEAALKAAVQALKHPSAGVRRNATLVLPRTQAGADALRTSFLEKESDPQVVLARLLALAEMPPQAGIGSELRGLAQNVDLLTDRHLPDALTAAAARHDFGFLKAIVAETKPLDPRALAIVARVAEHYGRSGPATAGTLLAGVAEAHPTTRTTLLTSIEKGWPRGKKIELTPADEEAIVAILPKLDAEGQGRLVRLMTTWGSKSLAKFAAEVAKTLFATLEDLKKDETARIAAATQLVELVGEQPEARKRLLEQVSPRSAPQVAEGVLEALGSVADDGLIATVLERYPGWSPGLRKVAVRMMLSRAGTTKTLLTALDKGTIQVAELSLEQQQALSNHPDKTLQAEAKKILARGGALPSPDRVKVIEERLALLKKTGDLTRGKEAYKKHCAVCHRHGGDGGNVGPDLTGFAVHPREEILIHILDPNRSVEGNFRVFTAQMRDGRVFNGLIASETRTSLELVDANAKRVAIQRDDIEELLGSTRSLMPEGFEKQLGDDGLVDLLEFLTQKGKYLPLPLDKAATVVTTKGMFFDEKNDVERLVFSDWKPKTVGEVPFVLVDPQGDRVKNGVLLYSNQGGIPPKMPRSVKLPCNTPAKAIHLLGGVAGWAFPYSERGSVSMIVRLHYADGSTEDHELKNGIHIADYIRKVDVPESKFAFAVRGQQLRYLSVTPKKAAPIKEIELVKGRDITAPVVMAITVETAQ
jgi:putative heme-binding domain-containing protein